MTRALVYEWRRITSIRSTYVLAALFVLATAAVAFLIAQASQIAVDAEGNPMSGGAPVPLGLVMAAGSNAISAIFLTTIAAQSFGHEYRYGLIRLTLSDFPRRWMVFGAKLLMVVAWVAALFIVSVAVAALVLRITGAQTEPVSGEVWGQLARSGVFLVGYCAIAFAITLLTRNLVLGVVVPLLLGSVVENLVILGLNDRAPWLQYVMPISSGNRWVSGDIGIGMDSGAADSAGGVAGAPAFLVGNPGLVYGVWVVVLLAAGYWSFAKRDA